MKTKKQKALSEFSDYDFLNPPSYKVSGNFIEFASLVETHGLKARLCNPDHFQITGGKYLVNYYPNAKRGPKIYVAGMTLGFKGGDAEAIKACNEPQESEVKESRKMSYTKQLNRIYKHTKTCYLCGKPIKREDASLDHFIPLSKGGLNNANNYRISHKQCNHQKGNNL